MDFSTYKGRRGAIEDLKIIYECAENVGISKFLFVNFGLLLGIIREKDFIPWDNDVDICIQADKISSEQEIKYFNLLVEKGMLKAREKISFKECSDGYSSIELNLKKYKNHPDIKKVFNSEDKEKFENIYGKMPTKKVRIAWFSLRKNHDSVKFCHWFMFPWKGFYWHTKSGDWVTNNKFDIKKWGYSINDDAIMQGTPRDYIEQLSTINFYGMNINIPSNAGSCLDYQYLGWFLPKKTGASDKNVICIVKNWLDEKTWKIVIN